MKPKDMIPEKHLAYVSQGTGVKFSGVSKKYPLAISCLIQDKSLLLGSLNYTTVFPDSSASRWHVMGFLSLYNCLNQYLRTNYNSVLFLKRILPNTAVNQSPCLIQFSPDFYTLIYVCVWVYFHTILIPYTNSCNHHQHLYTKLLIPLHSKKANNLIKN